MKLLFENWKRFLNESSNKDIIVHDINNIPKSGDPKLDKIIKDIISNLSHDLLKPEYKKMHKEKDCNPLTGHCFVATEAFWELTKELQQELQDKNYSYFPCHTKHEGGSHWFLKNNDGQVIDLTAGQFKTDVKYHDNDVVCDSPSAKTASRYMMRRASTGFAPTERTATLLKRIKSQ